MFSKELEGIIDAALADGVITDKERAILHKRAIAEGVDADELDLVIDGRLAKLKKQEDWLRPAPPQSLVNQKFGNVVKCPSCGAQVVGGSAICKECGYTFSNISTSNSSNVLYEKLEQFNREHKLETKESSAIETAAKGCLAIYFWPIFLISKLFTKVNPVYKKKMDVISTFPVPNTRADLLDFLTMLSGRINSTGSRRGDRMLSSDEDMSYAYWLLFTNCINKSKISFKNDTDFTPYFDLYESELSKSKGVMGFFKANPRWTIVLTIILFFVIVGILDDLTSTTK